jgi:superoxide dismutase, Fe-Mn family
MNCYKLIVTTFCLTVMFSCKKDTLIEQVDVPATPINVVKQEGGKATDVKANEGSFKMYQLPYAYNELEPNFDATTTEIHYSRHHLGYVNNLNKDVVGTKYEVLTLNDVFKNLNLSDALVRSNAGGFYNHNIFWETLTPNKGELPQPELMESINRDFVSFEDFKIQFTAKASLLLGSGWVWLISDKTGKLSIVTTANNDNPLMKNLGVSGVPLLTIDMWEHAYYLKFQNRKREYINTFFSMINWEIVSKKYDAIPNKVSKVATTAAPIPVSVPSQTEVKAIVKDTAK